MFNHLKIELCRNRIPPFHKRGLGGIILALLLSGCVSSPTQFAVPDKIRFQQTTFEPASHSQIDEMQQWLYLPSGTAKDPDNWQKGLLIFVDRNSAGKSLQERASRRKAHFTKQESLAQVEIVGQELQSQVIYPPTERFQNVQLEVSRGRDLACGFAQMQFADKRSVSAKNLQNLAAFQPLVVKLATEFSQLAWQIGC